MYRMRYISVEGDAVAPVVLAQPAVALYADESLACGRVNRA